MTSSQPSKDGGFPESKHLEFNELEVPTARKTQVFEVRSKFDDTFLGTVDWYGRWRQYVFTPTCHRPCVWSRDCLADLLIFIECLMERRTKVRAAPPKAKASGIRSRGVL